MPHGVPVGDASRGMERGRGSTGVGSGRHKLLGVRQAQGCIVEHEEYSHHFITILNGAKA